MTTSGTVGSKIYTAADLIDSIAKRCGVLPSNLTPEGLDTITGVMWRTLAGWSNRGINLWRVYHALHPIYRGQQTFSLAQGDIDVIDMVLRTPRRISASSVVSSSGGTVANLSDGDLETTCTQGGIDGNLVFDWGANTNMRVALIGLNSLPARTYNLVFEVSSDGLSFSTVLAPGALPYSANGWKWFEISQLGPGMQYFRVRETGGAIMSFNEIVMAEDWQDLQISRWNIDQWALNPSKRSPGAPRQFYLQRLLTPQANLWPVPDSTQQLNLLCLWIHRHIEDVGVISNTLDIPQRWYQPLVDVCAWLALPEVPGADIKRYEMLKDIAAGVSLPDAEKEERDNSPIQITMGIGAYTK